MNVTIAEYGLGDMRIRLAGNEAGTAGIEIVPEGEQFTDIPFAAESCVQVHIDGDGICDGFGNGHTMRNSDSSKSLACSSNEYYRETNREGLKLRLERQNGQRAEVDISLAEGENAFRIKTVYFNDSNEDIYIEMLSSFSVNGIIPGKGAKLHRLRSKWSAEGRLFTETLEDLQLEPSWAKHCVRSEKFSQIGSMPVRNFFPFAAVENIDKGIIYGASLACASSWQMEVYSRDDGLSISGGLADYETGHWRKKLSAGEKLEAPEAYFTVCCGNIDDISARLLTVQKPYDKKLPLMFNEYCTTWGVPTESNVDAILEKIKDRGFDIFVIDAGWFGTNAGWSKTQGDWDINTSRFPNGLKVVADKIRKYGMVPGLWFEFEVCGSDSNAYNLIDHQLKRNGKIINIGPRRFWDMRDSWTQEYLAEKVIGTLKDNGFGYIKVDYNETIGIGCDGDDSLGEGLRQNMLATQKFFVRMKEEIPGLIIENCSSGGHREEPSFMSITDMASFSDAHETQDIPIIAADLHRAIQPSRSQIWTVIRKTDDDKRIRYSLISSMLGIMCISGDVSELDQNQWKLIEEATSFYRKLSDVLRFGKTRLYSEYAPSTLYPEGWQAMVRTRSDGEEILAIIHAFRGMDKKIISVDIPQGYKAVYKYASDEDKVSVDGNRINAVFSSDMSAAAVLLKKNI